MVCPSQPIPPHQMGLSSETKCNTPADLIIGTADQDLGSVAMGCYSHLSDDEREQIGLAKALGHSIGAIAQAIGRPKSTVWRELSRNRLPSGRHSPLHAAGAYQLRRRREARIERDRALRTSLRPARGRVDPRANFRLAQGRKGCGRAPPREDADALLPDQRYR